MTETEFNTCTDPQLLLERLRTNGVVSDRKFRLFACGCVRRIWPLLADGRSRKAVEMAERFADGLATAEELSAAAGEARQAVSDPGGAAFAAWATAGGFTTVAAAAAWSAREAAEAAAGIPHTPTDADPWAVTHPQEFAEKAEAWQAERCRQVAVLRCVAGNPFHPVAIEALWRTPSVVALATAIYEERRFEEMPVLADALEEAGCRDDAVLSHCRGPGPHARGCYVLDLILAKDR